MSRNIGGPPYSESDVEYMRSRPWQFSRILRALDDVRTPEPIVVPDDLAPEPELEQSSEESTDASSPVPEPTDEEREYVMSLKVVELQKELRDAGLSAEGNKAELQARLLAAYASGEAAE
jgi:hypothetical protein